MSFFIVMLWIFGLAYAVGHARITRAPREWFANRNVVTKAVVEWAECPACSSTWYGAAFGAAFPLTVAEWMPDGLVTEVATSPVLAAAVCGLLACASSFLLGRATGLIAKE